MDYIILHGGSSTCLKEERSRSLKASALLRLGRSPRGLISMQRLLLAAVRDLSKLLSGEVQRVAAYIASEVPRISRTLLNFRWTNLQQQLESQCPHLLTFLGLIQQWRDKQQLLLLLIVAMLAKARNKHAHLIQLLISLVLLYGHASSEVRRINKHDSSISICMIYAFLIFFVYRHMSAYSLSC